MDKVITKLESDGATGNYCFEGGVEGSEKFQKKSVNEIFFFLQIQGIKIIVNKNHDLDIFFPKTVFANTFG